MFSAKPRVIVYDTEESDALVILFPRKSLVFLLLLWRRCRTSLKERRGVHKIYVTTLHVMANGGLFISSDSSSERSCSR